MAKKYRKEAVQINDHTVEFNVANLYIDPAQVSKGVAKYEGLQRWPYEQPMPCMCGVKNCGHPKATMLQQVGYGVMGLYSHFVLLRNKDNLCKVSAGRLAKMAQCSRTTINDYLKQLERVGLVVALPAFEGKGKELWRYVNVPVVIDGPVTRRVQLIKEGCTESGQPESGQPISGQGRAKNCTGGDQNSDWSRSESGQVKGVYKDSNTNDNTPTTTGGGSCGDVFDDNYLMRKYGTRLADVMANEHSQEDNAREMTKIVNDLEYRFKQKSPNADYSRQQIAADVIRYQVKDIRWAIQRCNERTFSWAGLRTKLEKFSFREKLAEMEGIEEPEIISF